MKIFVDKHIYSLICSYACLQNSVKAFKVFYYFIHFHYKRSQTLLTYMSESEQYTQATVGRAVSVCAVLIHAKVTIFDVLHGAGEGLLSQNCCKPLLSCGY